MNATTPDLWYRSSRLGGLRRFALALTAFNVVGHAFLGFEQSLAQPVAALATAYSLELLIEWLTARHEGRPSRFSGSLGALVHFLLSAHISALAVSMLLYANDRILPIMFATAVAIGSKALFRIRVGQGSRHFLNPSNLGISVTLLLFPWVGIAMPYQFTENLSGWADWILPVGIIVTGSLLNARYTGRMPLIAVWLSVFALQAIVRSWLMGTAVGPALLPMTGVAFILFTFYMVTDPATTPSGAREQMLFGASVALVYNVLMLLHVVFGLFFALSVVCVLRGIALYVQSRVRVESRLAMPAGVMGPPKP